MATITRGGHDQLVDKIKIALDEYERQHSGSAASLYRQNSGSVRVRIVDARFAKLSRGQRHDDVWRFIADRLDDDDIQEISVLLLLAPGEERSSFLNAEFDNPIPSTL